MRLRTQNSNRVDKDNRKETKRENERCKEKEASIGSKERLDEGREDNANNRKYPNDALL